MLEPGQVAPSDPPDHPGHAGHPSGHTDLPLMSFTPAPPPTEASTDDLAEVLREVLAALNAKHEEAIAREDVANTASEQARDAFRAQIAQHQARGPLHPLSPEYLAAEFADLEANRAWQRADCYRSGVWDAVRSVEQVLRAWQWSHPGTRRLGTTTRGRQTL